MQVQPKLTRLSIMTQKGANGRQTAHSRPGYEPGTAQSQSEALVMSDRVAVMHNGRFEQLDTHIKNPSKDL